MKNLSSERAWLLALVLTLPVGCGGSSREAEAEGEAKSASCLNRAVPVPTAIGLGGEVSSIAVADLDGDGCRDIAAYVTTFEAPNRQKVHLVVAFGDERSTYARRWKRFIAEAEGIPNGPPVISSRDTSNEAVAIVDVDGDGKLDVLTGAGVALRTSSSFEWKALSDSSREAFSPVRFFDLYGAGKRSIVRGTHDGEVESCDLGGICRKLPRAGDDRFPVTELVVGDFDHDGKEDLLVGRHDEVRLDAQFFVAYLTWLYGSRSRFQSPSQILGMHSVDLEVADFDGDGFPDVAAQVRETVSDFPSTTELWTSTPTGFDKRAVLPNHDNHQDKATLADIDGDGCIDYLKIGVDVGTAVHWGRCAGRAVTYDRAVLVGATTGIGVQFVDLNGDGKGEIVVRAGVRDTATLEVLAVPPKP